ncbi:MAG: hypothetical protein M3Y85_10105 [Bacteroidota bacterium]|nr:hypothetical protein [Bacteroidota bacterium]
MNTRIVFLVGLIAFSYTGNCQIEKGNWLVGGSGSYNRTKSEGLSKYTSRTVDFAIPVGYFIKDKFAAGIMANILFSKEEFPQIDGTTAKQTFNQVGIGPFMRYYFLKFSGNINILSEGSVLYTTGKVKNRGTTIDQPAFLDYSFYTGPVIFFNSSVGLEFLLGYKYSSYTDIDIQEKSIKFKIGFQIHLEKK